MQQEPEVVRAGVAVVPLRNVEAFGEKLGVRVLQLHPLALHRDRAQQRFLRELRVHQRRLLEIAGGQRRVATRQQDVAQREVVAPGPVDAFLLRHQPVGRAHAERTLVEKNQRRRADCQECHNRASKRGAPR